VAIAQVHGPRSAIEAVESIQKSGHLNSYYLLYAVLAEFESELNEFQSAATHLRRAIQLTELKSEQVLLSRRLRDCIARGPERN
jgi:RNA polymerase sigma-70 factor (ECF subfamily)